MNDILQKIEFNSMQEFLELINRNFALIQNSPIYRGINIQNIEINTENDVLPILDIEQEESIKRGSIFIFVDLQKFNNIFPSEINYHTDITLDFINNKLNSDINKLYLALNITEILNNDVLVLTDSSMYTYNNGIFESTGLGFNQQTSQTQSTQNLINNVVYQTVEKVRTIASDSDITLGAINVFPSYSKLYTDLNSDSGINIDDTNKNVTVLLPYIDGFNNTTGTIEADHTYYGTSETFGSTLKSTRVFGSLENYVEIVANTISTVLTTPLSSRYTPNINSSPAVVILQNDDTSGISIGLKNSLTTKTFAQIFKDSDDTLNILSNTGITESEYSTLKINKNYLSFNKTVNFLDSLNITKNLHVNQDFSSKHISFTDSELLFKTANNFKIDIDNINLSKFLNKVLVTDATGNILKTYIVETSYLTTISNKTSLITSGHFKILNDKINSLLSGTLTLPNYLNKILVTDEAGNILNTYVVETTKNLDLDDLTKIPTSAHIKLLNDKINQLSGDVLNFKGFAGYLLFADSLTGNLTKKYSVENEFNNNNLITSENKLITSAHYKKLNDALNLRINSVDNHKVPSGGIIMWAGTDIPTGWTLCNGSNGSPDLRGKFIVGYSDEITSEYNEIGTTGGERVVKLDLDNLPAHTHTIQSHTHTINQHKHNLAEHIHKANTHHHLTFGDANIYTENPNFKFYNTDRIINSSLEHIGDAHPSYPYYKIPAKYVGSSLQDYKYIEINNYGPETNQAITHINKGVYSNDDNITFNETLLSDILQTNSGGSNITGSTGNNIDSRTFPHENRPPFYTLAYIMKL